MRILGIDFGDRNLGLSLSDQLLITAQPFGAYRLGSEEENTRFFQDIVATKKVGKVVIGYPLRMNGSPGTRAAKTKEFSLWLERTLNIPVILWDERLTTRQAQSIMHEQHVRKKLKKDVENQISATIILLSYLECRNTTADAS